MKRAICRGRESTEVCRPVTKPQIGEVTDPYDPQEETSEFYPIRLHTTYIYLHQLLCFSLGLSLNLISLYLNALNNADTREGSPAYRRRFNNALWCDVCIKSCSFTLDLSLTYTKTHSLTLRLRLSR